MNWWHEQWRKDDPFGIPYLFILVGMFVTATQTPVVVVAVGMSFIVPVDRWFAVVAVLMGWAIQWRLLPVAYDRAAILIGVATAWIFGAYVAAFLLGPVPALAVIIVALEITLWAIGKGQDRAEAADEAAADAFLGLDLTPQQRFELVRARVGETMMLWWHVDEAAVDRLLDGWDAEAAVRGLDRYDWRYWSESNAWLRDQGGVSAEV